MDQIQTLKYVDLIFFNSRRIFYKSRKFRSVTFSKFGKGSHIVHIFEKKVVCQRRPRLSYFQALFSKTLALIFLMILKWESKKFELAHRSKTWGSWHLLEQRSSGISGQYYRLSDKSKYSLKHHSTQKVL